MKLREGQTFLSLYYEPNTVEVATGETDAFQSGDAWTGETQQLGQVATPEPLAALMARWVMASKPRTVLDPAAGPGGLLTACRKLDPTATLVGVERDQDTLRRARSSAPRGTRLILADYLDADAGMFDGIIANPPYVKAHRLDFTEAKWTYLEQLLGTRLDRLTNLYAMFLLKIWHDLAPHGRAAVLLPAEFLNANFGEEIKDRLLHVIRPVALMVFAPTLNLFPDALTTSSFVLLEKNRSGDAPCWLRRVDSLNDAESFIDDLGRSRTVTCQDGCVEISSLRSNEKWLNVVLNRDSERNATGLSKRVGDYFTCRRGIATGANDYFCLSRSAMRDHGLSLAHVEPCVSKATDAEGLVFGEAKLDALVARDRRCFLLNPRQNGQDLLRYLKVGEKLGIPDRYLPKHRPVWYLPENRPAADIWASVFSRDTAKFILNTSGAKNLTCFHGLYARSGFEHLSPFMTLYLNSSDGRRAFSQVNRFYGDGLNKLEPKDVEAMPCPEMPIHSRASAAALTQQLVALENLPANERILALDELAGTHFNSSAPAGARSSQRKRRV